MAPGNANEVRFSVSFRAGLYSALTLRLVGFTLDTFRSVKESDVVEEYGDEVANACCTWCRVDAGGTTEGSDGDAENIGGFCDWRVSFGVEEKWEDMVNNQIQMLE